MSTATRQVAAFQLGPLGALNAPVFNETLSLARFLTTVATGQAYTFVVGSTPVAVGSGLSGYIAAWVDDTVNPQQVNITWSATNTLTSTAYTVSAALNAQCPYFSSFVPTDPVGTVTLTQITAGTTAVRVIVFAG